MLVGKTGGKVWGMYGVLSLRLVGELGTTTGHDGLGGRTISNVVDSCEGRGWLNSVGGDVHWILITRFHRSSESSVRLTSGLGNVCSSRHYSAE